MGGVIEIEDLTQCPSIIDVRLDGQETVVIVQVQKMFQNLFPDGVTNGDPGIWGVVLSDVVRNIAQAHHEALMRLSEIGDGPTPPPVEACLDRLMQVLVGELDRDDSPEVASHTVVNLNDRSNKS